MEKVVQHFAELVPAALLFLYLIGEFCVFLTAVSCY